MAWFWDAYMSSESAAQRGEITASPLRGSLADLADLPPAATGAIEQAVHHLRKALGTL
jgi:hypothetical protein